MTPQTLTALLERLERAGAGLEVYEKHAYPYVALTFGEDVANLDLPELEDEYDRALLLGWAVQEIEATGFRRQIDWYSDGDKSLWEVGVFKAPDDRTLVYGPAVFATELEATLTALAEILEARSA